MVNKIIVACGAGVATSTTVYEKIKQELKDRGYHAELYQCGIYNLKSEIESIKPNVVVCTTAVSIDTDIPIVRGLPFLTGMGIDEVSEQIFATLSKDGN